MTKLTRRDHVEAAARALADLNIFYGVIALLDGGTISSDCNRTAQHIIKRCKDEAYRRLKSYDRHVNAAAPKVTP